MSGPERSGIDVGMSIDPSGVLDSWAVASLEHADDVAVAARLVAEIVAGLQALHDARFERIVREQLAAGAFDPHALDAAAAVWYDRRIVAAGATVPIAATNVERGRVAELAERAALRAWKTTADTAEVCERYFRAEDAVAGLNARREALLADRRLGRAVWAYRVAVLERELAAAATETAVLWGPEIDGGRGLLDPRPYTTGLGRRAAEMWMSVRLFVRRRPERDRRRALVGLSDSGWSAHPRHATGGVRRCEPRHARGRIRKR